MSQEKTLIDYVMETGDKIADQTEAMEPPCGYALLVFDVGDPDKQTLMTGHNTNVSAEYLIYILEMHLDHLRREIQKPSDSVQH